MPLLRCLNFFWYFLQLKAAVEAAKNAESAQAAAVSRAELDVAEAQRRITVAQSEVAAAKAQKLALQQELDAVVDETARGVGGEDGALIRRLRELHSVADGHRLLAEREQKRLEAVLAEVRRQRDAAEVRADLASQARGPPVLDHNAFEELQAKNTDLARLRSELITVR